MERLNIDLLYPCKQAPTAHIRRIPTDAQICSEQIEFKLINCQTMRADRLRVVYHYELLISFFQNQYSYK